VQSVLIEIPKYGFVKRRTDGTIDFVSPFPCPFNYGRIEGTISGDGDPIDAIVLGARLSAGTILSSEQRGTVHFIDDGRDDPKLVFSARPVTLDQRIAIRAFFRAYVPFKRMLNRVRGRRGITRVRAYEGI
jgi:inorganic pyrophosphatase